MSKGLQEAAKERELSNKLFGILPELFTFDDNVINHGSDKNIPLDFNRIFAQSVHQQKTVVPENGAATTGGIVTGAGGANTMESGRSNTLRGL